jgi:hypothetical protein
MTSDVWTIAMDIDIETYRDVIGVIKSDLLMIEHFKQDLRPISELQHVETLLQQLDEKVASFHEILPKKDSRRGLVNWAGNIMKTLIGAATIADVNKSHSLNHQVTYMQKLKTAERVYLDGVANLSATLKDHIIRSYNESQSLAHELMLFNISFLAQSSLSTSIRQLEFSLMKLTQQLDELMNAVQVHVG